MALSAVPIESLDVSTLTLRTDGPESDGTLAWDRTVMVLVEVRAGGRHGIGYTYADEATARVVADLLAYRVVGRSALDVPACHLEMERAIRNLGRDGVVAMAISAVDCALWDLKARLLDLPLCVLLGAAREEVAIYGSGGFTSYSIERLQSQLSHWVEMGIPRVKMKVGRHPESDFDRVSAARSAIGPEAQLFVDANGACSRKQALLAAEEFSDIGVTWFEEPVTSDDLEGLRLIRDRAPAGMDISAGEYGYDLDYFRAMLAAGAVDVMQIDVTRCGGITSFLRAAALCESFHVPVSSHGAPALVMHAACAVPNFVHIEYFHDHVRFEERAFDGIVSPAGGALRPDRSRPGHGLELKPDELEDLVAEERSVTH